MTDASATLLTRAVLDVFPAQIGILDAEGKLRAVNRAWTTFARSHLNGADGVAEGDAFVPAGASQAYAQASDPAGIVAGIQQVLVGRAEPFLFEFPSGAEWFLGKAAPLGDSGGAVLVHENVTRPRNAAAASAAHTAALERELEHFRSLASPPEAEVTAQLFGAVPLQQSAPATFAELTESYGALLDAALEQRGYRVTHNISEQVRSLSDRLGFLRCGPRDVVELHSTALAQKSRNALPARVQAYVEEGRLLLLELMGRLVSFYQVRAAGALPSGGTRPARQPEGRSP